MSEELERLEGKLDRMLLLMENMNKDISELKQGQNELKQDIGILKQNFATVMEAVNATNNDLTSKIDVVDKKVNINAVDILELRAAK